MTSALNRSITVHFISKRREDKNYTIDYEEALLQADRTARQYQIFLGLDTLPCLLKRNLDNTTPSAVSDETYDVFHLKDDADFYYTGKIIISLEDKSLRIEIIDPKTYQKELIENKLNRNEQNLQQLLERITNYGNDRNVQLLQLIDLNLLSSKGAYDEKKKFETLKERYDECMEYKRSMIVYDLDSLIGVNESESLSSMGTSTSSSVVNQGLYIYVTARFREAVIERSHEPSSRALNVEKWSIAVVRDKFLLKKFSRDVGFPRTEREIKDDKEAEQYENVLIKCVKCRDQYIESENKMGSCTFHDGFVYDNLSLETTKLAASVACANLNREEFEAAHDPERKEQIEQEKGRYKYICCDATLQAGSGVSSGGCKKGKHAHNASETLDFRTRLDILDRQTIEEWEQNCFDNDEYNERYCQLANSRSTV